LKQAAFTNTVIKRITLVFTLFFLLLIFTAMLGWQQLLSEKKKELLAVGTAILGEIANQYENIAGIKQRDELTAAKKVLAINALLQGPINKISQQYPGCGMGYYDIELNSIAAIAPNFDPSL
jgi:glycine betaine/choline ABC-type transport system substrate-binding protein